MYFDSRDWSVDFFYTIISVVLCWRKTMGSVYLKRIQLIGSQNYVVHPGKAQCAL